MKGSIRQRGDTYTVYWATANPGTGERVQHTKGGFKRLEPARPPRGDSAREFLNTVVAKVQDGDWSPSTKQTVKEFIDGKWLPSLRAAAAGGSLKPTTVGFYEHIAERHISPRIGGIRLAALTAPRLNALYAELLASGRKKGGGLSQTTVARVHVTCHRLLKDAVRWGEIQRNVADHATAPKPDKHEMSPWSPAQTRKFIELTAGDRLGPLWRLLAMTGLRRGEVCGLRWSDIDIDQHRLTVAQARVMASGKVVTSSPKTAGSARDIGLDPQTVMALRSCRTRQGADRLAAGSAWEDTGFVFTDELGRPLHPQAVSSAFQTALKAAGMPECRLHDLRHGYATAALEAGTPMKAVSNRLGHKSIAITADTYSHVRPEVDQEVADQVASLIMSATTR